MYTASSPQKSMTLTATDFAAGSQLVGIMSPIAYYDVPVGHIVGLFGAKNFRVYLKARKDFVNSSGGVLNLGTRLTRSQRPAGAFPQNHHPDLLVYGRNTGTNGAWNLLTVNAVDFDAGTVTLPALAQAQDLRVYFLVPDGEFEIRAARPVGSDGVTTKLFGAPFRAVHEVDQTNGRSAPKFGNKPIYSLPQNYRLTVEARSAQIIDWDALAEHELVISAADQPVNVTDEQMLMVRAEEKLRGGF